MGILYRSNKAEGEGEGRRVCRGPGDKRLIHVMLQRPAGRWPLAAGVARTGVPWRRVCTRPQHQRSLYYCTNFYFSRACEKYEV